MLFYPPSVYDVLLPWSLSVAVEDEVTVAPIEVTIRGGIHGHICTILDTPDLEHQTQSLKKTKTLQLCLPVLLFHFLTPSYLDFALAIVHHAVLRCHGFVCV